MSRKVERHETLARFVSDEPLEYKSKDLYTLPKTQRDYGKQFSSMYYHRLKTMKGRLLKKCELKWENQMVNDIEPVYVDKILDVENGKPSWIIGTIFSDLKYKPNVLQEVAENMYGAPPVPVEAYSDPENDQIMIEDESGRVVLAGNLLDKTILVSGNVIGLLGAEVQPGIFEVVDICYPESGPQLERTKSATTKTKNVIAIVSGLGINPAGSQLSKLELLKEFLIGDLLSDESQCISRLVIAGNSILVTDDLKIATANNVPEKNKYKALNKSNFSAAAVQILDDFLKEVLLSVPVTILPGESDPAEITYPQLPFHKSFFPKNRHLLSTSHFKRCTNPVWMEIDNCRILGTSGENITDIYKYLLPLEKLKLAQNDNHKDQHSDLQQAGDLVTLCPEDMRMPILESTLLCQNIVPTAPDTLCCYPYNNEDPFILEETPHVYFVGNQPKFETKLVEVEDKRVRLITIPRFDLTGEIVLMDTDSLECQVIQVVVDDD